MQLGDKKKIRRAYLNSLYRNPYSDGVFSDVIFSLDEQRDIKHTQSGLYELYRRAKEPQVAQLATDGQSEKNNNAARIKKRTAKKSIK